jgi:hypothetical protein
MIFFSLKNNTPMDKQCKQPEVSFQGDEIPDASGSQA